MPNTSYSEAMKEAATLSATDTVIIDTIEIAHPDIDSIYLANDRTELVAATGPGDGVLSLPGIGGNYASVLPADITLPTDYLDARIIFGEDYRSNPNFDGNVIPLALHRIVSGLPIYQAWYLQVKSDGKMYFIAWDSSNVQSNFSSGVTIPTDADGMRAVFRGTDDLDPSKASVQFFYSRDSGTTWVELVNRVYAPTAATITSLKQTTGPITIGERLDDTPNPFHGTIKFVELYGASGETDLRLRVDFRKQANGVENFTNDEGVPITVQTSSPSGDVGQIIRTDSVTYEPVGFKFKLPSITGNGVQDLSLEFSNVDRRVNDFIETVEASLDPVTVTHRVYLSGGDLNSVPESDPPLKLTLSDIEISAFTVRARASFVNIVNKQYPTDYYDRDRFPSI